MGAAVIEVVATYGISEFSALIRAATGAERTHIAVLRDRNDPERPLIEAWQFDALPFGDSVRWDYSDFARHTPGTRFEVWSLPVPPACRDYCMTVWEGYARSRRPYDWWALAWFSPLHIRRENPRASICSEGVIEPLANWLDWQSVEPFRVDPQHCVELLEAAGARCRYTGIVAEGIKNPFL